MNRRAGLLRLLPDCANARSHDWCRADGEGRPDLAWPDAGRPKKKASPEAQGPSRWQALGKTCCRWARAWRHASRVRLPQLSRLGEWRTGHPDPRSAYGSGGRRHSLPPCRASGLARRPTIIEGAPRMRDGQRQWVAFDIPRVVDGDALLRVGVSALRSGLATAISSALVAREAVAVLYAGPLR